MPRWTVGDVSGSQTLTDNDHLYPGLINELRWGSDVGKTASFNIFKDGATTYAARRVDNSIAYSGADSGDVIQSALDYLRVNGGGIVFIQAGTYLIGNSFTDSFSNLWGIGVGNKTTIIGEGAATVLQDEGAEGRYGLITSYEYQDTHSTLSEDVTIANLRIDGSNALSRGSVGLGNSERTKILNLVIDGYAYSGENESIAITVHGSDSLVQGCIVRDCSGTTMDGIWVTNGIYAYDTVVRDCVVENVGRNGITLEDNIEKIIVSGNSVRDCGNHGIYSVGGSGYHAIITNNILHDLGAAGMNLTDSEGAIVSGNIVVKATDYGIYINNPYVQCIGNLVKNTQGSTTYGISARQAHLVVANNACYDTQGTKTQDYGINYDGATYSEFIGNYLRGNGTAAVTGSLGTGSEAVHNIV